MIRKIALGASIALTFVLAGCDTMARYQAYSSGEVAIKTAQAAAQAEKYRAMAQIASSSTSESAKVAAVVAMAMETGGAAQASSGPTLQAPADPSEIGLKWASILVPATVQGYGINANKQLGLRQSDNATALGIRQSDNNVRITESNNSTFLGLGGMIPAAPITVVTPAVTVDRPAAPATTTP